MRLSQFFTAFIPSGISIHAPLAGCDQNPQVSEESARISIHAPLAGCDGAFRQRLPACTDFNPRTPCGVRRWLRTHADAQSKFQSTHPLRGATYDFNNRIRCGGFQSTHPLRGATTFCSQAGRDIRISIHAPLAGCDYTARYGRYHARHFNPRTPCGVRPYPDYKIKAPD